MRRSRALALAPALAPALALAFALALALAPLLSCGTPAGRAAGGSPAGTVAPQGPSVVLPSGLSIRLELARTDEERSQGLMFRASLPPGAGMVFLFDTLEVRPFWMKNCHFPIDIVHVLSNGSVVDVLENVPPCAADPCPSYPPRGKSDTVVELNAGVAKENGVRTGARLRFVGVPGR